MSFILDALRKVEKDKNENSALDLDEIVLQNGEKPAQEVVTLPMFLGGVAIFVFSLSCTWFFLDQYTSIKVPPFPGMSKQKSFKDLNLKPSVSLPDKLPTNIKPVNKPKSPAVAPENKVVEKTVAPASRPKRVKPVAKPVYKKKTVAAKPKYAAASKGDFILEGILFHPDVNKRSVMLRIRGEYQGSVIRVGEVFRGFEVSRIEENKVTLLKGSELVILTVE